MFKKFVVFAISSLFGIGLTVAQPNLTFYNFRSVAQTGLLNPAQPSRQQFTIGIIDFYNNTYIPGITANDIFNKSETGDQTIKKILDNDKYNLDNISLHNQITPMFIGLKLGKNYVSFGVQTTITTEYGIPKDLLALAYYGNAGQLFGKKINVGKVDLFAREVTAVHFGYSRDINENLTLGFRAKYLIGLLDAEVLKSEISIQTDSGANNTLKMNARADYEIRGAGFDRLGDMMTPPTGTTVGDIGNQYYKKPIGSGFSVDLGMNYRINKKFSVSASVLDLGYINWLENTKSYKKNASFSFEGVITDNADSFESAFNKLSDSLETIFKPTESNITYKSTLSPKVYIGFQYNLYNSGALGGVFFGEMWRGKFRPGASISFSQRIWRFLDLRVNYNFYNKEYTNFGAGLAMHLGPMVFYAMGDNAIGALNWDKTHFSNARIGLNINIGGRFDSDNDGVTNRKDKCKKIPGLARFSGCPDTDGDGVPDREDECVSVKGTVAAKGCPDMDGDGVKDIADSCINEKGSAKLLGCPDQDNDGVADKYDECPKDSGSVDRKGCPDDDGDGILNKFDECPLVFGSKITKGCPDFDKDSVADKYDDCPKVAGPVQLKGCPDTDGDGIIDKNDSCAKEPGPAATIGCPDTDNDGIADKYDNCPTEAGTIENGGCPALDPSLVVLSVEEKKVLNEAFSNLEFETGTAKISAKSLESLVSLAELLSAKPAYKLEIAGHTDNVGKEASNLKLSRSRALAVKTFLTSKGVDASRLKAEGFGSKKPVAENNTAEGRQRNRRVEFKIVK